MYTPSWWIYNIFNVSHVSTLSPIKELLSDCVASFLCLLITNSSPLYIDDIMLDNSGSTVMQTLFSILSNTKELWEIIGCNHDIEVALWIEFMWCFQTLLSPMCQTLDKSKRKKFFSSFIMLLISPNTCITKWKKSFWKLTVMSIF